MELKDFIKGVIFDITNAVKECQQELNNGAIIAPTGNWNNKNQIQLVTCTRQPIRSTASRLQSRVIS